MLKAIASALWHRSDEDALTIARPSVVIAGYGTSAPTQEHRDPLRLVTHAGKGVATRSVALICRYAFDVLRVSRREIRTIADNAASRRVAVKPSFQLEGRLRRFGAFERYEQLLRQRFDLAVPGRLRSSP